MTGNRKTLPLKEMFPARMYNFVRSRQLEGTYPGDVAMGNWIVTGARINRGWGMPTEADWPYDGDAANWPPKQEPQRIDQIAKTRRVLAYQRVRTIDECRYLLAAEIPVLVALQINPKDWEAPPNAVIPLPGLFRRLDGTHAVLLVGYKDDEKLLIIRNSWGATWGESGYGYIHYEYFEKYQLEAWVNCGPLALRPKTKGTGLQEKTWELPDYFSSEPLLCFDIFDASTDECIAWAFVVKRQGAAEIEEFFVRPMYRRKGHGSRLAEIIRESPLLSSQPLRLWISYADEPNVSDVAVRKTLRRLHLKVRRTNCRWAPYVAM